MRTTALLALLACNGDDETTPDTTDTTDTTDFQPDSSGPAEIDLTGKVGSVVLVHSPADAYFGEAYGAEGMFLDDTLGVANLTYCVFNGGGCYDHYPTDDTPISSIGYDYTAFQTYDVGSSITVGSAALTHSVYYGLDLYFGYPSGFVGTGGVTLDGDFAPYAGTDDFGYPDLIQVTAPDPTATLTVGPGDTIDLAWVSPGQGDVYLETIPGIPYSSDPSELRRLDDVGSYSVAVDSLGMAGPLDQRILLLSRIVDTPVDAAGNTIQVQTRSDQWLYVNYVDPPVDWVELDGTSLGEDCAAAAALPPLVAGNYYGDLVPFADDYDLGDYNPITGYASPGRDAVVPIALLAGQRLTVTYTQTSWDASSYLFADPCDDESGLAGADDTYGGETEDYSYTAGADETVWLVLDAYNTDVGGTFSLTVEIE